jgi:hypothetical protein
VFACSGLAASARPGRDETPAAAGTPAGQVPAGGPGPVQGEAAS